jgi:hypothetical protein
MKIVKLICFVCFLIIITGCSVKKYDFPKDEKSLSNYDIDTFYNLLKVEHLEIDKGNASEILPKGYEIVVDYCISKNGKIENDKTDMIRNYGFANKIYLEHKKMSNLGRKVNGIKSEVCIVDNSPLFFISTISFQYGGDNNVLRDIVFDKSEETKNQYLTILKEEESRMTAFREKQKKREEKRQQEELQKEKAKIEKINYLKNRKGQYTMRFFNGLDWKYDESKCLNSCIELNQLNTGYTSLQEALNNGWQFISKINDTSETINNSCICKGTNILLKR